MFVQQHHIGDEVLQQLTCLRAETHISKSERVMHTAEA